MHTHKHLDRLKMMASKKKLLKQTLVRVCYKAKTHNNKGTGGGKKTLFKVVINVVSAEDIVTSAHVTLFFLQLNV